MRSRGNTQEDYLLRMIRQAGEALRRLRHRLLGGGDASAFLRQDAITATERLLGAQAPVLELLDPLSAVRLVGHPTVVALWTALIEVEAGACAASGDGALAGRRRARAAALRDAATDVWGPHADPLDDTEPMPADIDTSGGTNP